MWSNDWFWIIWWSVFGLAVVLFWYSEFSGLIDSKKKKSKKKSMWQASKSRVLQQSYKSTYGTSVHYNAGKNNYRKGM